MSFMLKFKPRRLHWKPEWVDLYGGTYISGATQTEPFSGLSGSRAAASV